MLQLLNGSRSSEEIQKACNPLGFSPDATARMLEALARKQLLMTGLADGQAGLDQRFIDSQARTLEFLSLFENGSDSRYDYLSRIRDARVAIIGAGGLGSWLIASLAGLGVGEIAVVDHDEVEIHNLARQVLYRSSDLGSRKVDALATRFTSTQRLTKLRPVPKRIESSNDLEAILGQMTIDVVAVAADWPPRLIGRFVSQACAHAGIGSIYSSASMRSISVGPFSIPGQSSCYECLWRYRLRQPGGIALDKAIRQPEYLDQNTPAIAPIPALTAQIMAWEIVCYLTGMQRPVLVDALVQFDLDQWRTRRFELGRDGGCSACREAKPVSRPLGMQPLTGPVVEDPVSTIGSVDKGGPSITDKEVVLRWQPKVLFAQDDSGSIHITDLRDRHFQLKNLTQTQWQLCQSLYHLGPFGT
jgi:molybdopterin-synthase adenylyltransferase